LPLIISTGVLAPVRRSWRTTSMPDTRGISQSSTATAYS